MDDDDCAEFFTRNSSFVPHSPLSYSNSYVPPLRFDNTELPINNSNKKEVENKKMGGGGGGSNGKSILKNSTNLIFGRRAGGGGEDAQEHQQKQQQQKNSLKLGMPAKTNNHPEKKQQQAATVSAVPRKEALKTVAFGLTTNLEQTVMGKDGKGTATSRDNGRTRTAIFSHEALSLHKEILDQKLEIDELRRTVSELTAAREQQRSEAKAQIDIISRLDTRVHEMERWFLRLRKKRGMEEIFEESLAAEQALEAAVANAVNDNNNENNADDVDECGGGGVELELAKGVEKINCSVDNAEGGEPKKKIHQRSRLMKPYQEQGNTEPNANVNEVVLCNHRGRNEFLHRLEGEMERNPTFEQRLHTMLRVWSEDSSVPRPLFNNNNKNNNNGDEEDDDGCCTSMHMRVTTQRQVIYYSTSPGRRAAAAPRRFPATRGTGATRQQPRIVELTDEGDEHEKEEEVRGQHHYKQNNHRQQQLPHQIHTLPNVRRSEHDTDDVAEFFPSRDDNDDRNYHQHDQRRAEDIYPFNRRRKREATSTIRNCYR